MHWPALGTVIPYQAIPDLRVKYASKSKPPRVGRLSTRRSSESSPEDDSENLASRDLVTSRAARRDARAIRLVQGRERERDRFSEEREL